jgi:hypothetical protein
MIKVPFDTPYHGDSEQASYMIGVDLGHTLDNAYKTMDWFKFLADKQVRVEIIGTEPNPRKKVVTTWVGFELEPKNETFYRLKYDRYEI